MTSTNYLKGQIGYHWWFFENSKLRIALGENEVFKNIDFSRVRIPIPRGPQSAGVYAVNLYEK